LIITEGIIIYWIHTKVQELVIEPIPEHLVEFRYQQPEFKSDFGCIFFMIYTPFWVWGFTV